MTKAADIGIIGGGLAGLYSASLLSQQGFDVTVLEARDRIGGRIHGLPLGHGDTLDLGPCWFWPHQHRMARLCQQLGLPVFEQYTTGDALYQATANGAIERFAGAGTPLSYRIDGGVSQLTEALHQTLDEGCVHLNQRVHRLNRQDDHWNIETPTKSFKARRLIMAVPPRAALESTPIAKHLSAPLQRTLRDTPTWMAAQAKFVAHYTTPFWREQGLAGDAFSRVGPLVEIHDASAGEDRGYALFGFIGVSAQQRATLDPEALRQACLNQLGQFFGADALNPIQSVIEDWSQQAFTCTPQDRLEPPQHPECDLSAFAQELAQLQLAFASTEVAFQEAGYLEGALIAAHSAASPWSPP